MEADRRRSSYLAVETQSCRLYADLRSATQAEAAPPSVALPKNEVSSPSAHIFKILRQGGENLQMLFGWFKSIGNCNANNGDIMPKTFDLSKFKNGTAGNIQYQRQLHRITALGNSVESIESAVRDTLTSLSTEGQKTFVIYGEPQSGKTEMMICLTARLLDEGRQFILHLMNDSVDLLGQNLGRFQASGLAPAAQNFSEILDPSIRAESDQVVSYPQALK